MRDLLLERVRPMVERLAVDLTELAMTRVEAELDRMRDAFEVALSSYAGDGAPDLLTAALGPELANMLNAKPAASPKRQRDIKPAKAPAAKREPVNKGGKMVCKACGFVGGNARGCGRSHPTQGKSEVVVARPARAEPPSAPVTFGGKPDRFAAIESRARARQGTTGV
jgi:hypothetical protein